MIYNKKYEYKGKIYCEDDLSLDIDNYGGCLYRLYLELQKNGEAAENTIYYCTESNKFYDYVEDMIELEFEHLEV